MQYLIWLGLGLLYAPIFTTLYQSRWENIDYTHAYFILPVSLWLTWRMRRRVRKIITDAQSPERHDTRSPVYLSLLTLGLLMFILGWRKEYLSVSTLSLIPVLFGLTGYLYGGTMVRLLLFPIVYLLLLVPPPLGVLDAITLPMRYGISVATHTILKAFGYPITRDGLLLAIRGHEIYMGAPCSGFRSLITMISLGLAYVYYIGNAPAKTKAILLAAIVPFALLGNLIRVIGMCLVTYYFGGETGSKFHDISGFVIFLVLILGLIALESLLQLQPRRSHLRGHNDNEE